LYPGFCYLDRTKGEAMKSIECIKPYTKNQRYWQYNGKPVMLLGGSVTDHLFLIDNLEEHLDEMVEVGANYVRNTMSQRDDRHLLPYRVSKNGLFDLNMWNEEYWNRFAKMLKMTHERQIFVQIEVWDRFDFSKAAWARSPWNPVHNVNYSYEDTLFTAHYPHATGMDLQPFFHTAEMTEEEHSHKWRYWKDFRLVLDFQEAFVEKMLSYGLLYDHVLYCMNNETTSHPQWWGQYWIRFIQEKAAAAGKTVHTTDMFEDAFMLDKAPLTPIVFDDPRHYTFADVSQINVSNFEEENWNRLRWIIEQVSRHPRPINETKVYGKKGRLPVARAPGNEHAKKYWWNGTEDDAVQRFWFGILAGCAGLRFHRPNSGLGLSRKAKASISAARKLETLIKPWEVDPCMELLSDREENSAYLAAKPGEKYTLYYTNGGSVSLDMRDYPSTFGIRWINIETGDWHGEQNIEGGKQVSIKTPSENSMIAAIVKR
jgi:hypothetical protein